MPVITNQTYTYTPEKRSVFTPENIDKKIIIQSPKTSKLVKVNSRRGKG